MAAPRVQGARRWSVEEDAKLLDIELTAHTRRFAGDGALARVARKLGRTEIACRSRLYHLKREAGHVAGDQWTLDGLWTPEQDRVIREAVGGCSRVPAGTWPDVAARLGRTVGACKVRGSKLRRLDRDGTAHL